MFSFDKSQTRKKRKTKATVKKMTRMTTKTTTAIRSERARPRRAWVVARYERVIIRKCRKKGAEMNIAFLVGRIIFGGIG